ncbi:MAG: DEAD/DEAH box helicase family protein, partial [Patescibacteria group bacterium]|nr:DEAD/DEAH box helicase family protein [Patescibacteria group bacterium]
MKQFVLKSKYKPTANQQNAIDYLSFGIQNKVKYQVLLGVTGSGKTFTVANTIQKLQKPALIISHNKTLAAQLYQEFRDFFPDNAVSYFVSYYDYYQPEAYIPSTDTYIEKDADINELIDKLRLEATMNISTRHDTIVVASVSCIYNIGSPKEYASFVLEISSGMRVTRE